jgi:hypothetical protein
MVLSLQGYAKGVIKADRSHAEEVINIDISRYTSADLSDTFRVLVIP